MPRSLLPVRPSGQVIVTGSLAFDQIMVFPGYFKDHILPEKLHVISISFLVSEMRKQRGGCAGNIAYTLALLGERPRIVATAGDDFTAYRTSLEELGVDVSGIVVHDDVATASCFITSDRADNQITGFFVGAMGRAAELSLASSLGDEPAIAIIAPDDPAAMVRHCQEARQAGLPFLFDPSFQVTAMDGPSLAEAALDAKALVVNDYEHTVFEQKTGKKGREIFDLVELLIVTLGEHGSRMLHRDGEEVVIPAARISQMVDPTGGGDAYRGGLVAGVLRGYDLGICGRMGSVAAAYAVEHHGTQNHAYTREQFWQRYRDNFGDAPEA